MGPVILPKRVRRHGIGRGALLRGQFTVTRARLEVRMRGQCRVEAGQQRGGGVGLGVRKIVSTIMFVSALTGLIQETEHPPAPGVHQLADDGVAEEPDLGPLDPLAEILHLVELYDVGQLLRVDPHSLRSGLLSRFLELGPDSLVTDLSASEAGSTRDTLCRTLYSRLFTYVVSRINESIKVHIQG